MRFLDELLDFQNFSIEFCTRLQKGCFFVLGVGLEQIDDFKIYHSLELSGRLFLFEKVIES